VIFPVKILQSLDLPVMERILLVRVMPNNIGSFTITVEY